jgi:predicted permease
MLSMVRQIQLALRRLARDPGFTSVALTTLALGLGASVAIFTVVNAVMLRPLPYPDPGRLVELLPGRNANIALADAIAAGAPSVEASTGLSVWDLTLTGQGDAAAIPAQVVDAGFFPVFGVTPALGRPLLPDDRDPANSDVVLLSHGLWRTRFGSDPSIIGRRIQLDGYGHSARTVVGVMPPEFTPPLVPAEVDVQLWVPLSGPAGRTVATDSSWYVNHIVGRLRAGATVERAAEEVRATMSGLRAEFGRLIDQDDVRSSGAMGLLASLVGDVRTPLLILLSAVGLVLLLACANLANLLLARGEKRRQELAVRAALGAGRQRLVREQLAESTVLALLGGAAGVVLARGIIAVLRVSDISGLPRSGAIGLDLRVLAFALAVSLLAVLGFGLLPALRATAGDLRGDLGAGSRAPGHTRAGRRIGAGLIAGEIALAMVVVTGAGLLLSSLRALRAVDPGLDPRQVLAVQLAPPDVQYRNERSPLYYQEVLTRLAALPGVRQVGAIHLLPFTLSNWAFPYLAQGHAPPTDGPLPSANFRVVTPGYFQTAGTPLIAGRDVQASDGAQTARVGLINRTMARQLWPGENAVGKEIQLFGTRPFQVIGVVGDVRQHHLDQAPRPEMYLPLTQFNVASMYLMLRTSVEPASLAQPVRRAIAEINADIPIADLRPLQDVVSQSLAQRRFFAGVLTFFGLLALALGAVGVYGVMAYSVGARRGEFGIRMALGATRTAVVGRTLMSGLVPLAAGLAIGLAAVVPSTRLLATLLFGVGALDPRTLTTAALVLGAVATVAIWVPARRASRVQPAEALRGE